MRNLFIYLFFFFSLLITNNVFADIYVTQNGAGTQSGASCVNAYSVSTINGLSLEGQIINVCGNLTTSVSFNSGDEGATLQNDSGGSYEIDPTSGDCVSINGIDNITIKSNVSGGTLILDNPIVSWIDIDNANGILIDSVVMTGSGQAGYEGVSIETNVDDVVIKNSNLSTTCNPDDLVWIEGDHVVLLNNTFGQCAHQATNPRGTSQYIIIKENTYWNPIHGSHAGDRAEYTLSEGNVWKNSGSSCSDLTCTENTCGSTIDQAADGWKHNLSQLFGPNVIIRGNLGYSTGDRSFFSINEFHDTVSGARVYNNTIANACQVLRFRDAAPGVLDDVTLLNNIFRNGNNTSTACTQGFGLLDGSPDGTAIIENNNFSGTGSMRYRGWSNTTVAALNSNSSEWSGNTSIDPLFETDIGTIDSHYQLQSDSLMINAGRYHAKTVGSGSSSTSMTVTDGAMFFSKEAWGFTDTMVSWDELESDTIRVMAATPFTVQITNKVGNVLTLASAQTWENDVEIFWCRDGVCFSGSSIDVGAYEYDSGAPTGNASTYSTLPSNLIDSEGNNDLTCTGGSCTHSGGLVVDDASDGYGQVTFDDPSLDNIQITEIIEINLAENTGSSDYVLAGRWNKPNGRNDAMAVDRYGTDGTDGTGAFKSILGYNNGDSAENYTHNYTIPTSTDIWIAHTIDGQNKLLNQYVMNDSGTELGTDVEDQAILSGRTWNYAESDFTLGAGLTSGVLSSYAHGTIKYYKRVVGILPRADIVNIVTASGDPSPTISSSDFCECDSPYTSLSADVELTGPGEYYCWKGVGSEAFYPAAGGSCSDWTVSMNVGGNMDYYAGCESSTVVFRGQTTQAAQKLGELQPASSTPINENGTDVQDSEANSFDLTGISTSETNTYIFNTSPKPKVLSSDNAPIFKHSDAGQPLKQ